MMKDVGTMSPLFLAFILEGVGDIVFRLEAQDLDDCRTLPLDSFSSTLVDAVKLKFNVEWLSAKINFLKALKGNWPATKRLLTLIHQHQKAFKAHRLAEKEAESTLEDLDGAITRTRNLILQMQQELASRESSRPALQGKVQDIKDQKYSFVKEVELAMKDLGIEGNALAMLSTTGLFEKLL
jgi:DNA repair exonuclease SbcCD ATPase subunit